MTAHSTRTELDTFGSEETASHGEVHVVSRVVGFKKIKFYTNENVGSGELDLPEQQMHTSSYWLTVSSAMRNLTRNGSFRAVDIDGVAWVDVDTPADRHDAEQRMAAWGRSAPPVVVAPGT